MREMISVSISVDVPAATGVEVREDGLYIHHGNSTDHVFGGSCSFGKVVSGRIFSVPGGSMIILTCSCANEFKIIDPSSDVLALFRDK